MKKTAQKLDANQVLQLIEGCRNNLSKGIGPAIMNSLNKINPELHGEITGSPCDPSINPAKMPDFFRAVASEAGYVNVPKNFKK